MLGSELITRDVHIATITRMHNIGGKLPHIFERGSHRYDGTQNICYSFHKVRHSRYETMLQNASGVNFSHDTRLKKVPGHLVSLANKYRRSGTWSKSRLGSSRLSRQELNRLR
jgi:hypothetical protein